MNNQDELELENEPDETPDDSDELTSEDEAYPIKEAVQETSSDADDLIDDSAYSDDSPYSMLDEMDIESDFDIAGALASVATLSDVIAEQEAQEAAEQARADAEIRAAEDAQKRREAYYFERPPSPVLERGQIASVVPALLLIASGAWLTFAFTTADDPPQLGMVLLLMAAATGVSMLSYWLASERWSRGALFGGLAVLLCGGVLFFITQSDDPGANGWPLLIAGLGAAMSLSGLLSPPVQGRQIMAGVLFIIVGAVGFAVTTDSFGTDFTDTVSTIGPFALVGVLILLLLPMLVRRRG